MLSKPNKKNIPNIKPIAAGIQAILFCSVAILIDGIRRDQTDAAIITPDAKPNKIFSMFLSILFFIKNTIKLPAAVPIKGIANPKNRFIFTQPS